MPMRVSKWWISILGAGLLAAPVAAQAPPPAAAQDPAFEAAKGVFEAMPEADRRAIQDGLIWTGDYKGVIDGGFGRGTRNAIVAFARRTGLAPDGTLDTRGRANLAAAAISARVTLGFAPVRDAKTGIVFALPAKILGPRRDAATGSRWVTSDGAISVETTQIAEGDGDLPAQFARLTESSPARKVTYKLLRPDFAVVSGEAGKSVFYTRLARGTVNAVNVLRGYTITYPAGDKTIDNVSIAMANAFQPFAPAASAAPGAPPLLPAAAPTLPPSGAVIVASGLIVGADKVMSAGPLCEQPKVNGRAARVTQVGDADRPTLLDVPGLGGRALAATALAGAAGQPVIALFAAATAGRGPAPVAEIVVASGDLLAPLTAGKAMRILAPLQDAAGGAPIFDRTGALVGLVGPIDKPRRVAGLVPQAAWPMIPASQLALQPSAPPRALSAESKSAALIASAARGAVVAIACPR